MLPSVSTCHLNANLRDGKSSRIAVIMSCHPHGVGFLEMQVVFSVSLLLSVTLTHPLVRNPKKKKNPHIPTMLDFGAIVTLVSPGE